MSNAMKLVQAGIIYLFLIVIINFFLFKAGAYEGTELRVNTNDIDYTIARDVNSSSSTTSPSLKSGVSFFKVIFSFFVFNITGTDNTLTEYMPYIRIVFVYIPLAFLGIALFYSTALSSGGG